MQRKARPNESGVNFGPTVHPTLITGLVPVISIGSTLRLSDRDGRDKPGHDNATAPRGAVVLIRTLIRAKPDE